MRGGDDKAKIFKSGEYKLTTARLTEIPKANGKTRTLSITFSRDKRVQKLPHNLQGMGNIF